MHVETSSKTVVFHRQHHAADAVFILPDFVLSFKRKRAYWETLHDNFPSADEVAHLKGDQRRGSSLAYAIANGPIMGNENSRIPESWNSRILEIFLSRFPALRDGPAGRAELAGNGGPQGAARRKKPVGSPGVAGSSTLEGPSVAAVQCFSTVHSPPSMGVHWSS